MEEIIKAVGTNLVKIIGDSIRAGKSMKEAEIEAAKAVQRGDVVSQEMYDRMKSYISSTKSFEDNG
jgi:hypothetical protein